MREDLGRPVKLQRLLAATPDLPTTLSDPAACIHAASVPAWHRLNDGISLSVYDRLPRGTLMGWERIGADYLGCQIHRPEYEQICIETKVEGWQCDISDVHGFGASKSKLTDFSSTDAMVERNSRAMIDEITPEKLAENLAHDEIRILHRTKTTDHFACYQWDGRLWLINSGGSHHFAAAKYIAARLPQRVPLQADLRVYTLNEEAISSLRRDFEMFVVPNRTEFSNGFFGAMRSFGATWYWHGMPSTFNHTRAILLPRSERRSMRVADELAKAGVVDLGRVLSDAATNQAEPLDRQHYVSADRPRLRM
ncbi:hypothetical protein QYH69_21725 [Paraburkholderia sp. SARCC-3016]|uniref:DUF6685 family protein n=1 Tax=Paraburkholderia sp. SARCC-3016 TaxID=3058611 RepID=UPI002807241D|nr:DUF6685 family protein [Paraburkholderia sp. SARCC-3016]MDQ7979863.1 hypothetical protein [Paraburkholderia sp. SARCC-3016]